MSHVGAEMCSPAGEAIPEPAIEHTTSLCQQCYQKIPAELFVRDNDV